MNCPRCSKLNPEAQKYCGECGCALDQAARQLESLVSSEVERVIRESFRDRRIVEVETTEAVALRVWTWAKAVGGLFTVLIVLLVVVLGGLGISSLTDFRKQVETSTRAVKRASSEAVQSSIEAQHKAGDAQTAIQVAMQKVDVLLEQASRALSQAQAMSNKISKSDKEMTIKVEDAWKRVTARLQELSERVDGANKAIEQQKSSLATFDDLVKNFYSKLKLVILDTNKQGARFEILPGAKSGATVYILLDEAVIRETLQIQWHIFLQPRDSYIVSKNLIIFNWGDAVPSLRQHTLAVTFVPDATKKEPLFKSLSVREGVVYADGSALPNLRKD